MVNLKRSAVGRAIITFTKWSKGGTYTLPKSMISLLEGVAGSGTLTTQMGVPMRKVPSNMSTPKMIGSRVQKAAMILSLHGHTAWGAASLLLASMISLL